MFIMNVYLFKSEQRCLRSVAAAPVLVFLFPRAVLTEVLPHFARSSTPAPLFSPTQQRGLLVMFQSSEGRNLPSIPASSYCVLSLASLKSLDDTSRPAGS